MSLESNMSTFFRRIDNLIRNTMESSALDSELVSAVAASRQRGRRGRKAKNAQRPRPTTPG